MFDFTIIIPHKNTPDLLQRCLESIPVRADLEVIIVDDNSGISIVDFNCFPGKDRKDVEIVYSKGKNGKGPGYARNLAMTKAKGRWIIFADSDDYFTDSFSDILDEYKKSPSDVIFFKCLRQNEFGLIKDYPLINDAIDDALINNNTDAIVYGVPCPWGKFIKRDFLEKNRIKYQEITGGDDILFSLEMAINLDTKSISNSSIYCVVDREGSLTRNTNWRSFHSYSKACVDAYKMLEQVNKEQLAVNWLISWWGFYWAENRYKALLFIPRLVSKLRLKDAKKVIRKGMKRGKRNWKLN
jgi:glycosyltransferase involved in cell wall biosynthesis